MVLRETCIGRPKREMALGGGGPGGVNRMRGEAEHGGGPDGTFYRRCGRETPPLKMETEFCIAPRLKTIQ